MSQPSTRTIVTAAAAAFAVYLGIYYWPVASEFLGLLASSVAPLVVGLCLAYPLGILMSFFERHFLPRVSTGLVARVRPAACLAASMLVLVLVVAVVVRLVVPQVVECVRLLVAELPDAADRLFAWLSASGVMTPERLDALAASLGSLEWREMVEGVVSAALTGLAGALGDLVSGVATFFLGLVFAVFVLMGRRRLSAQCGLLMDRYLGERARARARYVIGVVDDCFHRFLVGQCTEAAILGALCTAGMALLGLPHAMMIGALTALMALIPIVGALLSGVIGAFLILMESPVQALVFIVFIVVLQQLEGDLIYPHVVGSSIQLPGIWVLAAVTVGGGAFGILGMFLGVPLAAVAYRLLRNDVRGLTPPECRG